MKITKENLDYLTGEKFDVNYQLKLEPNDRFGRIDCILKLVKGKKVIHVGCCDHIGVIKEKIENNTWLHKLLNDQCEEVIGIDINKEAIDYIKKNGYANNIVLNNISIDKPIELNAKYDYMILGEILEHIDNPVDFLKNIREKYADKVEYIIVTVPNALKYCVAGKINYEKINSDHRYYFTPYTLSMVFTKAGFIPDEILFADAFKPINLFGIEMTRKVKSQFGMTVIGIAKF